MTRATAESKRYATDFRAEAERIAAQAPAWTRSARERAWARFEAQGIPTTRLEAWRDTRIDALGSTAFVAAPDRRAAWSRERLDAVPLAALGGLRLVFVNGRYAPGLSDAGTADVTLGALTDGDASFGSLVPGDGHPFAALNGALFEDAAVVRIAPRAALDRPVHLVHLTDTDGAVALVHPRSLVIAGDGCEADIVESHLTANDHGEYAVNPVTEVRAGDHAVVRHYRVQNDSDHAWHVGGVFVSQGRAGQVASLHVALGAKLARVDAIGTLAGEGGYHELDGLYLLDGERHVDHHTTLDHASPRCGSRELFKGILSGRSRGVFHGRIIVREDAQKTDAKQSNPNLLLSDSALINTRPQLEIYADDVKCTHGATVGQIDREALFYLRSRGIEELDARDLLIHAFASDILNRVRVESLREGLERAVSLRLPRVRDGR